MHMRLGIMSLLFSLGGMATTMALADGTASPGVSSQAAPAPAPAPPQPLPAPSAAERRGLVAFERSCASCHGREGDGRGQSARHFVARPTNFQPGVYKCRSTASGVLPTDEDLRRSILDGLPGSGMPPFNTAGPLQLADLVATLKYLSPRFSREPQGPAVAVPAEPPNDPQSVARGAQVYDRLKCANCHGWRGEGGPGAANLHNDDGTPAEVTDFTRPDSLRCGSSPSRLYLTVMTGLDGTPMASFAEVLAGTDAWDLVHYILSVRHVSAREEVAGAEGWEFVHYLLSRWP
jgi:cytochrome c oxidase cbb3-type subunit 2